MKKQFPDQQQPSSDSKMVQVVAEEVIMTAAQWLIAVVNRTLQPKPNPQVSVEEESVVINSDEHEKLIIKLGTLVERLYERDQVMTALEKRIHAVEKYLEESGALGQHIKETDHSISALKGRLDCVENLIQQNTPSLEFLGKVERSSQIIGALEDRVKLLEGLLIRFRVVPKAVGGNSQAIAALKNRLAALEALQNSNHKNGRETISITKN